MYSKLFASILDSSVWLQSDQTRLVWLTLLAAKGKDGFARFATMANLAARARVDLSECAKAVAILEAPDPDSSNQDYEGRRLERVPGGWMVRNATLYDAIATQEDEREQTRVRVARHRARASGADPDAIAPKAKRKPGPDAYDQVFLEAWGAYPKRPGNNKQTAWRQWLARVSEGVEPLDMLEGTRRYAAHCEREQTEPRYVKMGQTFYGRDRHFANDFVAAASNGLSRNTQIALNALKGL